MLELDREWKEMEMVKMSLELYKVDNGVHAPPTPPAVSRSVDPAYFVLAFQEHQVDELFDRLKKIASCEALVELGLLAVLVSGELSTQPLNG